MLSQLEKTKPDKYTRWEGDTPFNKDMDSALFKTCYGDENAYLYFNLSQGPEYLDEKPALEQIYASSYQPVIGRTYYMNGDRVRDAYSNPLDKIYIIDKKRNWRKTLVCPSRTKVVTLYRKN